MTTMYVAEQIGRIKFNIKLYMRFLQVFLLLGLYGSRTFILNGSAGFFRSADGEIQLPGWIQRDYLLY